MRKLLKWIVVLYCLGLAGVWFGRFALIYPFNPEYVSTRDAGEPRLVERSLTSFDGTKLIVWTAKAATNKPTVIYFHGNAGNLATRAQRFDRLLDRGFGVVAMAYRGSSGSQGHPDQKLIMRDTVVLHDALSALGVADKSKRIFYGESLGTGVAVQLANSHPPDALILEAPYKSITDLAAKQMPIFPIRLILDQRWSTLETIESIDVPLLVLHGEQDQLIPVDHGKAVFNASPSKKKILKIVKTGGHENLWSVEGQTAIYDFIKNL
jgi:fermentation-respiration switch protein FrsA (DUF1100 family)